MDNKKKLLLLAFVFFLIYMVPQTIRNMTDGGLLGFTTYYQTRVSDLIASGNLYDPLSLGGRYLTYPPGYPLLLSLLPSMELKEMINPVFGALGIILAFYFAKYLNFNDREAFASSIILGLTPGFLYLSSHVNPRLPTLVFLTAGFLIMLKMQAMRSEKEKLRLRLIAAILFTITWYFHPLVGTIGLVFGAVLFRKNIKPFLKSYLIGLAIFGIWLVPLIGKLGLPGYTPFYSEYSELQTGIQHFVFESGTSSDTIGVLVLILALFSFFKFNDKSNTFLQTWLVLGVVAALAIGNRVNEQLLFPVALLAGRALVSAWPAFLRAFRLKPNRLWLYVFCGYLLMNAGIMMAVLTTHPPYASDLNALNWIKDNTPKDSVVLAPWYYGHWVTGIAGRKNVIDAYAEYAPNITQRYYDYLRVFEGSDQAQAVDVLKKYNVNYVFYDFKDISVCSGFQLLAKSGYFEEVYQSLQPEAKAFVFKFRPDGTGKGFDLCPYIR